jgi:exopolyphosphatase/guanosine-5'-triphosphate,3'-diphosphate pyrophosphatase
MIKAVIDLGTNTFNLLIASIEEDYFEVLWSGKEGVALGMGGINEKRIAADAFERGLETLNRFKQICEDWKVVQINAIGTSALRDATNSIDFLAKVKELTNIDIEIVSGEAEAELIYRGVSLTYHFQHPAMIMDIGGGSTEFIFADKNGIFDLISLNIGVSRMFQEFQTSDPLTVDDAKNIENWLEAKANGYFDEKQIDIIIGASGTFETFYELIHNTDFPSKTNAVELSREELDKCLENIIHSTQAERDKNDRIIPIRKKMAPIAAVKTRWILNKLAVKQVVISPCSLKEGALM